MDELFLQYTGILQDPQIHLSPVFPPQTHYLYVKGDPILTVTPQLKCLCSPILCPSKVWVKHQVDKILKDHGLKNQNQNLRILILKTAILTMKAMVDPEWPFKLKDAASVFYKKHFEAQGSLLGLPWALLYLIITHLKCNAQFCRKTRSCVLSLNARSETHQGHRWT